MARLIEEGAGPRPRANREDVRFAFRQLEKAGKIASWEEVDGKFRFTFVGSHYTDGRKTTWEFDSVKEADAWTWGARFGAQM